MTRPMVLVAIALLGCGIEPAASQGTAWPDCAPWDGAATRIVIPLDTGAGGASRGQLTLALYEAPEALRGALWRITTENMNRLSVSLCQPVGDCVWASDGWVRVASGRQGSELRGQYRVTLANGSVLTGRFSAPLQARVQMCG